MKVINSKVASLSGDARRALEICKRALELASDDNGKCVQMAHVMKALKEMLESPIVEAIK
jgi:origin recognition complex subunit 1